MSRYTKLLYESYRMKWWLNSWNTLSYQNYVTLSITAHWIIYRLISPSNIQRCFFFMYRFNLITTIECYLKPLWWFQIVGDANFEVFRLLQEFFGTTFSFIWYKSCCIRRFVLMSHSVFSNEVKYRKIIE